MIAGGFIGGGETPPAGAPPPSYVPPPPPPQPEVKTPELTIGGLQPSQKVADAVFKNFDLKTEFGASRTHAENLANIQTKLQTDLSNTNFYGQLWTNVFNWGSNLANQILGYLGLERQEEAKEEITRTWAGVSRDVALFQKELGIAGTEAAIKINAETNDYNRERDKIMANTKVEIHEKTLEHQKEMAALGLIVPRDEYTYGRTLDRTVG